MTAAILLLAMATAACPAGEIYTAKGSKIEVQLVPEKATIMLGEPIYLDFVVQNHSDRDLQVIVGKEQIPSADNTARFRFSAEREDGRKVVPPPLPASYQGTYDILIGPHTIPARKSYTFYRFLPTELPIDQPGKYTITCRKQLEILRPARDGGWDQKEKADLVEAQVRATLTVLPPDPQRMGEVIAQLGRDATIDFGNNGRSQEKAERDSNALSVIQDARAIPWLVKLLESHTSTRKFQALAALAKFDSPVAFAAIKTGLATRGTDLNDCTTATVAADVARLVRQEAARALTRSPYRDALPLLFSLRHDPDETIRLFVVQAAGEHKTAEASRILQEMTADPSPTVRDEATRYLRLHAQPPAPPKPGK